MTGSILHISLEFDPYIPWHRGMLQGIEAFAREVPEWRLLRHRMIPGRRVYLENAAERMDGMLSMGELEWARKSRVPLVRFGAVPPAPGYPVVDLDYLEIGRLAARNLIENGYRRLVLLELDDLPDHERMREDGLREEAAKLGIEVQLIPAGVEDARSLMSVAGAYRNLIQNISGMDKPLGLFARSLREGYVLHSMLQEGGFAIPDEVGLIVGGNDRELLGALQPPVTSVSRNSYQIGYTAAATLHRMLDGETVPELIVIPPGGVVDRGSTRLQAIGDPVVQQARRLIRERIGDSMNVDELARELGVSGRSLRRRFQAAMRHSPVREVQLARLEKAKELLSSSRISVLEIAQRCGFAESCQLSTFFKKETGHTPTDFRGQALQDSR